MTSATIDRRLGLAANTAFKTPVALATTANITLSGEQTIDGTLTSSSRVLVKNQTDTTTNGIYDTSSGTWTRAIDANGNYDLVKGTTVLVTGGSSNIGAFWKVSSASPTIGTSMITFDQALSSSSSTLAFLQAGTGAASRSVQDKLREEVSVMDFGAVGDGTTDDTAAFTAAFTSLGALGGTVTYPESKKFYIGSNLTIPASCTLRGPSAHLGLPGLSGSALFTSMSSLRLLSTKTITLEEGSSIVGCLIYRSGMTFPAADGSAFAGVALTSAGDDASVFDCLVLGFTTAFSSTNYNRPTLDRLLFDCTNGVLIQNCLDVAKLHQCHGWPFTIAPASPTANTRRGGYGFQLLSVGDWNKITDCFTFGYFRGFNVSSADHCVLLGCGADNFTGYTNSIGILIDGTSADTCLIGCQSAANGTGFYINTTASLGNHTTMTDCQAWGNDSIGLQWVGGDVHLTGGSLRTTGIGVDVQTTTGAIFIDRVRFENISTTPIKMSVANPKVYLGEQIDFGGFSGSPIDTNTNRVLPTVVAAAILPVPSHGRDFQITGTTTITSIFAPWAGRIINLLFKATVTVTHGASIVLKGATNRSATSGQTMTLFSDGVVWYEI